MLENYRKKCINPCVMCINPDTQISDLRAPKLIQCVSNPRTACVRARGHALRVQSITGLDTGVYQSITGQLLNH